MTENKNVAARMGRWSAQHRKKAIFGWLAFVVLSLVIGGALGVKAPEDENTYVGDSGKAHALVDQHFPSENTESILVKGKDAGAVRAAVDDTVAAVSKQKDVYDVQSPFEKGNEGQLAKDGAALVNFKLRGDETAAETSVEPVLAAVAGVQAAHRDVFVGEFGTASANKALSKAFEDDFKKAETLSLPITLLILVLAFGALVAAGVPLLLGLSAVMAALGLVALPSQIVPLGENTASIAGAGCESRSGAPPDSDQIRTVASSLALTTRSPAASRCATAGSVCRPTSSRVRCLPSGETKPTTPVAVAISSRCPSGVNSTDRA